MLANRAAECITNKMLTNTWQDNECLPDVGCATNGAYEST